jgi:hypothetical protein
MQIQKIYEELRQGEFCASGYAFSRDYMSKDRSYYSVLIARRKEPSIEAWLMLNFALQRHEQILICSGFEQLREKAAKLNALQAVVSSVISSKCMANIR